MNRIMRHEVARPRWMKTAIIGVVTLVMVLGLGGTAPASADHAQIQRSGDYRTGGDLQCGDGYVRASSPIVVNAVPGEKIWWLPVLYVWNGTGLEYVAHDSFRYDFVDGFGSAGPGWTLQIDPTRYPAPSASGFDNLQRGYYYAIYDWIYKDGHWQGSWSYASDGNRVCLA